ncbi:U32 family peptidase [Gorillibacterium sp. CAU 1737]|uniref:U32 family peptidase n=1 Tax=Gorillibacterium sp. CAU 1737 TaxID=3140362 RepID=UPI0032600089
MDNLEFTRETNRKIFETIEWLREMKVDWVTVAMPYLVSVIKQIAPEIKVSLSTFSYVDTLQKAIQFEKMGVDEITLPEGLNRNFPLLKTLRRHLSCTLQLIATNVCMAACAYRTTHTNSQSHASQEGHVSNGVVFDYCMLKCTEMSIKDPVEIIKMPWIRPEDTEHYENIGLENFKITERMKRTDLLIEIAQAYTDRRYDGPLDNLLNFRIKSNFLPPNSTIMENTVAYKKEYLLESRELLFSRRVQIDNNRLDGFLDHFIRQEKDCRNILCGVECRHCHQVAAKVLNYDERENEMLLMRYKELLKAVSSGALHDQEEAPLEWPEEVSRMLNFFLEKKPEFIRNSARASTTLRAEKYARERKSERVEMPDLVKANFEETPREFRAMLLDEMKRMGIEMEELIS